MCEPVCEPSKCHTSCQEPKNAVCDVKCEKPDCEVRLLSKFYYIFQSNYTIEKSF